MIWLLALQLAMGSQQDYEEAKRDLAEAHYTQADREVDSALHSDPRFVPALVLKGRLAILANRPEIARQCLIAAVTLDPKSADAQFFLGTLYYTENNFKLSVSPLRAAESLAPTNPMPAFYLAMAQEGLGNIAEALTLYQKAEDLAPQRTPQASTILVAYGRLLYGAGDFKESLDKERRAIEANEQSREAHYELAKGLVHEGDLKQAASEAERALTLPSAGTSDSQVHFLLGNIYLRLGQKDLALDHLAQFNAATAATNK